MSWIGKFPRPLPAPPAAAIPGAVDVEIAVRSEAELRAAIGAVVGRFRYDPTSGGVAFGGAIVLAAPFKVKAPIIIPGKAVGLRIRGIGYPIHANEPDQGVLFDVRAPYVRIEGIFAYGVASAFFNTFAELNAGGYADRASTVALYPNNCTVRECIAYTDRLFVDATAGNADDCRVLDCECIEANATHYAPVYIDSSDCRVVRCGLPDGGGDTITVGANGERAKIVDNDCGGGDITTSASAGYNKIDGNTQAGTISSHATDAVGMNP